MCLIRNCWTSLPNTGKGYRPLSVAHQAICNVPCHTTYSEATPTWSIGIQYGSKSTKWTTELSPGWSVAEPWDQEKHKRKVREAADGGHTTFFRHPIRGFLGWWLHNTQGSARTSLYPGLISCAPLGHLPIPTLSSSNEFLRLHSQALSSEESNNSLDQDRLLHASTQRVETRIPKAERGNEGWVCAIALHFHSGCPAP